VLVVVYRTLVVCVRLIHQQVWLMVGAPQATPLRACRCGGMGVACRAQGVWRPVAFLLLRHCMPAKECRYRLKRHRRAISLVNGRRKRRPYVGVVGDQHGRPFGRPYLVVVSTGAWLAAPGCISPPESLHAGQRIQESVETTPACNLLGYGEVPTPYRAEPPRRRVW
jgi:hypothetical protein